jgi:DNA polymerase-1
MLPYAAMDSWATFKLYEKLRPEVDLHFKDLYDTDRQVLKILWKLEQNGVLVDRGMLEEFQAGQLGEQAGYLRRLYSEVGREFDVNSTEELRKLFYEELKMPIKFYTEKDKLPSTEDAALTAMDHPVAELLQLYRGLTNTLNYAKGLLTKQDSKGVVHGDYSITRAKTGRFSCSDPNLQATPKHKGLRACFIPDPGYDMFYFDHAQIEMVGFAHYSKDPKMMAALQNGVDLHTLAAAEVYGVPVTEVSKQQRAVGKGTNFSIIYGVGKKKLATYINGYMSDKKLTDQDALLFKEKYFARFPSVIKFQNEAQNAVRRRREPWGHFIKNQFGRVRRIQDPQQKAYTAVNHLIQGWAPDVMKQGMVKIDKLFTDVKWRQNVHDELRIDIPKDLNPKARQDMIETIVKSLTNFPQVRVPIKCKVEWSDKSWADLKEWQAE